jgi:hypothetical protein
MKKSFITLSAMCVGLACSATLFAQAYEGSPCDSYSNPALKKHVKDGSIPELTVDFRSYINTYQSWASSSLAPDTKRPVKEASEEDFDFTEREHRWTCMYTAFSARDGDTKTAWVEGMKDDGIGEVLLVKVDASRPVEIWAGIGASPALFKANNRPKRVRVTVFTARETDRAPGAQYSLMQYDAIKAAAHSEIELADVNGYQPLPLPKYSMPPIADVTFVAIEILSVYRGSKYSDTAITEVRNK